MTDKQQEQDTSAFIGVNAEYVGSADVTGQAFFSEDEKVRKLEEAAVEAARKNAVAVDVNGRPLQPEVQKAAARKAEIDDETAQKKAELDAKAEDAKAEVDEKAQAAVERRTAAEEKKAATEEKKAAPDEQKTAEKK